MEIKLITTNATTSGVGVGFRFLGNVEIAKPKPILFGTTEEFLRRFSIHSLDDLPSPNPEQVETFKEEAEEEVQLKLDI